MCCCLFGHWENPTLYLPVICIADCLCNGCDYSLKEEESRRLKYRIKTSSVGCYIEMDLCLFFLPHTRNPCYYKRHKCNHPFDLMIGKGFLHLSSFTKSSVHTPHEEAHSTFAACSSVLWSWKMQYALENHHVYKWHFWTIVIQGTAFGFPFRFMII